VPWWGRSIRSGNWCARMARSEGVRGRIVSCAGRRSVDNYVARPPRMLLTVRQRQQAVRVWAMRLWAGVVPPSSEGCGAPSVLVCAAVATSIARLSPAGGRGRGSGLMMLGLRCGGDRRARPCPRVLSRRRGWPSAVQCAPSGETCRVGDVGESSIRQRHLVHGMTRQCRPSDSRRQFL
jgi:hypothetical protein